MILFKPQLPEDILNDGSFYICATIADPPKDLEGFSQYQKDSRNAFSKAIEKVISEDPEFKLSSQPIKYMETIAIYEYKNSIVQIDNDEWFGIMIQSKDRDLLETILEKLKRLSFNEDNAL